MMENQKLYQADFKEQKCEISTDQYLKYNPPRFGLIRTKIAYKLIQQFIASLFFLLFKNNLYREQEKKPRRTGGLIGSLRASL